MVNNHFANSNSQSHHYPTNNQQANGDEEVNFLYLKHVIMKFLTSREYEVVRVKFVVGYLFSSILSQYNIYTNT